MTDILTIDFVYDGKWVKLTVEDVKALLDLKKELLALKKCIEVYEKYSVF